MKQKKTVVTPVKSASSTMADAILLACKQTSKTGDHRILLDAVQSMFVQVAAIEVQTMINKRGRNDKVLLSILKEQRKKFISIALKVNKKREGMFTAGDFDDFIEHFYSKKFYQWYFLNVIKTAKETSPSKIKLLKENDSISSQEAAT